MSEVSIWFPPASEHDAWQAFTGDPMSRADFERAVSSASGQVMRLGHEVHLEQVGVSIMQRRLRERRLENTPDNRASCLLLPERRGRVTLGMTIAAGAGPSQKAIGYALIDEGGRYHEKVAAPVRDGDVADAVCRILAQLEDR